jgi:hypothetical protein
MYLVVQIAGWKLSSALAMFFFELFAPRFIEGARFFAQFLALLTGWQIF